MKRFKSVVILAAAVMLTSACSTTQQAYINNIQIYFESKTAVSVSDDRIKESPADLIFVKNGQRGAVTMALAFIENGQHKWVSSDSAMLVLQKGRLVRTAGLEYNVLHVSNLEEDPLALPSSYENSVKWERVVDTEQGEFGLVISSQTTIAINQAISIQSQSFMTKKYTENVSASSVKYGNHRWTNIFWVDQASGQLLKSSQKVSPKGEILEITYLSRALRLLEQ